MPCERQRHTQNSKLIPRRFTRTVGNLCVALCWFIANVYSVSAQIKTDSKPPLDDLVWNTDSRPSERFVSVHGHRAAVFGYSQDGLEVWAYPFQIVSSYTLGFRVQGTTSAVEGQRLLRRIIYSPESITRIYVGPDFIIREHIFVPLDEAGAIFRYEVHSPRPIEIDVHFTPVLNLMWPGGIGGQSARWSSADSAYLLSEETHRFIALVGSSDIVSHDETPNASRQTGPEPGLSFTIRDGGNRSAPRVIIAAGPAIQDASLVAKKLKQDEGSLEKLAADHYLTFLNRALQIETPDESTNRGLAWSEIALEQAWVCNPELGCGLAAGYGPSRMARRPQYDWFFAGDGMVDLPAMLASGQYELAREELEFIIKYQDKKTGMIWHELSQSAGWIDWSSYPYMFVHVELTFDFLNAVENYYSTTGDREFVEKHWPEIESAYGYCRSLINPQDGLPHIPAGKEGAREQERLTEELALSASWITASHAFSHLARATGHDSAASQADASSREAARTIPSRYWDEKQNFWITGYTVSGTPLSDRQIGPVWILGEGIFSDAQRDSILQQLASSDYQTDWGSRGRASSSSAYDPNSYANGSVWAVSTAAIASAFWSAHRPATASPIWRSLVPWSSLDSLGHMHETLAGDYYHEELESVPEQTWSSATFFSAAVAGLLGLDVDATSNHLVFAPHLPPSWHEITLRILDVGSSEIQIKFSTTERGLRLEMQNSGDALKLTFDPEIPLGAQLGKARFQNRTISALLETHQQDSHAKIELELPHGNSTLTVGYSGGVQVEPDTQPPATGDPSHQIKITKVNLQGARYTIDFDYIPAVGGSFELYTPWHIDQVRGAQLQDASPYKYRVTVGSQAAGTAYEHGEVQIFFAQKDSK